MSSKTHSPSAHRPPNSQQQSSSRPSMSLRLRLSRMGGGGLIGTVLFLWTHQFLATFGTSIPVACAMTLVLGLGFAAGLGLRNVFAPTTLRTWLTPITWFLVAAGTVTFPWLLSAGRYLVGWLSLSALESEATVFCVMLGVASIAMLIPTVACGHLAVSIRDGSRHEESRRGQTHFSPLIPIGVAIGLVTAPSIVAPLLGLQIIGVLMAVIAMGGFWVTLNAAASGRGDDAPMKQTGKQTRGALPSLWMAGLCLLIGLQLPLVANLVTRLMPASGFVCYALWSGLLFGLAIGLWRTKSTTTALTKTTTFKTKTTKPLDAVRTDHVLSAAVVAVIWPMCLLAVWPLLIEGLLMVNANVSVVGAVMAIRMLIAGLAMAPLGMAIGRLSGDDSSSARSASHNTPNSLGGPASASIVLTAAGVVIMTSLGVPTGVGLTGLATIGLLLLASRYWVLGLPTLSRRAQLAGVVCAAVVAASPIVSSQYRPDRAAQMLFSSQTFAAYRSQIDRDLLTQLDDTRLVSLREGRESAWTVWRHRGSQLSLRENGLPRGIVSTDPTTCPQFSCEVLTAVVPIVLHKHPDSVLVLGLGSTVPLTSVLACPVQKVTCIERDADLIALVDHVISPQSGDNPLDDDRVTLVNTDPTLGLMASDNTYDVILIGDGRPSVFRATPTYTREFYAAARRSLKRDGIVCQRLQYADFGREPIEDILATLQAEFPQVVMVDSPPGEMLLLATTKTDPLVDESLITRCEATHIRRLTAQMGWDWSVLLSLSAISPEQVFDLTRDRGTPNRVTNGRFAYGLPQEVMRWGPKWQEMRSLVGEHGSQMLAWVDDTDADGVKSNRVSDVRQRLADVAEQQRLIIEHPDHFWAYRAKLKERLKERPRAKIQQVKHEGLLRARHPEDKRRIAYLEVLSDAATVDTPSADDIAAMTRFAEPYDPLVSYFLHQEAARLYEKTDHRDPQVEYHHWRYSVFFGPPQDRSVRNVIAALRLLNEHPELIDDPTRRFDEMNALLEVLKHRTNVRVQTDNTAQPFELVDAERSIDIAKRSMITMDGLRADAEVSTTDWQRRKTVLERMLIRPMWTYHSQQASRLARLQARGKQLAKEPAEESTIR